MKSELSEAIDRMGIEFSSKHISLVIPPKNTKGDNWEHDLWEVTLSYQGRKITTSYRTGLGHRKVFPQSPNIADVVHSMLLDASCINYTFEDWCDEFGYNSDSRKALKVYLDCQDNYNNLHKVFGSAIILELQGLEH